MANTTISFGVILLVLGIGGYFGSGMVSLTALIPALFGLLLLICGVVARDPNKRKHAMHFAAMVGLLGFLGSARGLAKIGAVLAGQPVERQNAVIAQAIMAILMLIFTALCVRSFIQARRSRTV
jgi:uncharacterized membrane protein